MCDRDSSASCRVIVSLTDADDVYTSVCSRFIKDVWHVSSMSSPGQSRLNGTPIWIFQRRQILNRFSHFLLAISLSFVNLRTPIVALMISSHFKRVVNCSELCNSVY